MRPTFVLASLATLALGPTAALARPFTAGVDLGLSHSMVDGSTSPDPSRTLGVFGRVGLTPRLSGQLELQRIRTSEATGSASDVRTATALLVAEVGARGRLIPLLLLGMGLDAAEDSYGSSRTGHHLEGGLGLEYRATGGLVLGADVRMGGRIVDAPEYETAILDGGYRCIDCGSVDLYMPPALESGEYRSARLTLGVRF